MTEAERMDEWRGLLAAAERFREAEPWRWLADWPLLGLQDPVTGEMGFGSVMGAAGQAFGLLVFRGREGLWVNAQIVEESALGTWAHQAAMQQMYGLSFTMGDREEVSPALRKTYRQAGHSFRGRNKWPVFTSFVPGFENAEPADDEVGLLARWLERATLFVKLLRQNDELFDDLLVQSDMPSAENDGTFRIMCLMCPDHLNGSEGGDESEPDGPGESGSDGAGGSKHDAEADPASDSGGGSEGDPEADPAGDPEDGPESVPEGDFRNEPEDRLMLLWADIEPLRPLPVYSMFDEMEAARLRRRLPKRSSVWEFEVCPTPLHVGEARDRAQTVQLALCAEEGSGFILGFEMLAGPEPLEPARQLLAFMKKNGYIPAEVGVTREDVAYALSPLTETLDIELVLYDRLPDLEEAYESLMEHLAAR